VYPPGEKPLTDEQIADIVAQQGGSLTRAAIYQLRTGKRMDPRKSSVESLARAFRVPVSFFFVDEAEAHADAEAIAQVAALRDAGVMGVTARAVGVSSGNLKNLIGIMDRIREMENLPQVADGPDDDQPGRRAS
jgi:transcriptional regulator with XRE-family HTH domain